MNYIKTHKIIALTIGLILSSVLYYQFIYIKNNPSVNSLNAKYANNPELINKQDQVTSTDKQIIGESEKRPLLAFLPYSDGYVYISTSRSSYHLLVQYTTSLSDANKTYNDLLKKYNDTGRHYDVNFRKVPTLIIKE